MCSALFSVGTIHCSSFTSATGAGFFSFNRKSFIIRMFGRFSSALTGCFSATGSAGLGSCADFTVDQLIKNLLSVVYAAVVESSF
jgi:hypothetical protein